MTSGFLTPVSVAVEPVLGTCRPRSSSISASSRRPDPCSPSLSPIGSDGGWGRRVGLPLIHLPFRFGFSNGTLGQGGSLGKMPVPQDFSLGTVNQRSSEETNR